MRRSPARRAQAPARPHAGGHARASSRPRPRRPAPAARGPPSPRAALLPPARARRGSEPAIGHPASPGRSVISCVLGEWREKTPGAERLSAPRGGRGLRRGACPEAAPRPGSERASASARAGAVEGCGPRPAPPPAPGARAGGGGGFTPTPRSAVRRRCSFPPAPGRGRGTGRGLRRQPPPAPEGEGPGSGAEGLIGGPGRVSWPPGSADRGPCLGLTRECAEPRTPEARTGRWRWPGLTRTRERRGVPALGPGALRERARPGIIRALRRGWGSRS